MSPFEQIIELYHNAIPAWQSSALGMAKALFYWLVLIQILWSGILWMLTKDDPTALMLDFVKKIMVILFFWMVLLNYEIWIPAIYESFREVGVQMTGTNSVSPADIMGKGIELSSLIIVSAKQGGFIDKIIGSILAGLIGLGVFVLFVRIGLEMVLVLIGGKILLTGGIILLAFSGNKWTMQYAERYISGVIALGLKLLFITLLVGIGESQVQGWADILKNADADHLMEAYLSISAATFVYYYLCTRIPDLAVTMFTGPLAFGFGHGAGSFIQAGLIATGVGVGATPRMTGEVVKHTAGMGSAISQAVKASSTQSGGSKIGSVISQTGNSVKTLGTATGEMIKQEISDSISQSPGGRIANHIRTLHAANPIKQKNNSSDKEK